VRVWGGGAGLRPPCRGSEQKENEILLATFREEDAAAGRNVSGAVSLKQVISKLDKAAPHAP